MLNFCEIARFFSNLPIHKQLFLKNLSKRVITKSHIGAFIGNVWLLFFMALSWMGFGLILFGVAVQWILVVFVPTKYDLVLNSFLLAWFLAGVWLMYSANKKPGH